MVDGAIPIGGFVIDSQIGGGGHGLVWRGRHEKTGLPVAVKVLPPAADRLALHGLKNEVQAIARLHHPHVVAILDTGFIDARCARAAAALGRPLDEGSPWLALELASGGDLAQLALPLPYPVVSDVLRTLLAALAHAHARGVIHRDIKPANVLLCTRSDARPGLKLTDFGLASWEKVDRVSGGTPLFMAPEQFDASGRDVGPWTDLYALGCVARYLLTGSPPFSGDSWHSLANLHRSAPPARLELPPDAPDAFAGFLERLLQKDPAARFRCAADADAALATLDPRRGPPPLDRLPAAIDEAVQHRSRVRASLQEAQTLRRFGSLPPDAHTEAAPALPRPHAAPLARVGIPATTEPPPGQTLAPPSTWRPSASAPSADLRLVEAGLSLWGLRPVPLVGRAEERDLLWSALLDVHRARAPHLVCLRGASGVGKSRVVEWMSHRADELGAAQVLRAHFSENPGRNDGFAGLVARLTRVGGLEADEARERAAHWLSRWLPGDHLAPEELCGLAGVHDGAFPSSAERHGALVRLLVALSRQRPLLVWLDDVHWGADALLFLERVLDDAPELRALFVCTAVDELLSRDASERLDALAQRRTTSVLSMGPLDEGAHHELCRLLLGGAASDLADDLRRRTEGNPMFALHVVGDWVQRGLLTVSPQGLALVPGARPEPPDALFRLWDLRLAAALSTLSPGSAEGAEHALQMAAVLGSAVDLVEWEAASDVARDTLDVLMDALVSSGLARRTDAGILFVHVLVRSAIERRAREGERLAPLHRAAADALSLLWGTETPIAAARIGRHLLAAGEAERAAGLLLRAAQVAVDEGEVLEAAAILVDWERARQALGMRDDDARAANGLLLRARVALDEGRYADARRLARGVQHSSSDPRIQLAAHCVEGRACVTCAETDQALVCFTAAQQLAEACGDKSGLGQALLGLGEAEYYRGDRMRSMEHYQRAKQIFSDVGRHHDMAQLLWALGYVEVEAGNLPEARRLFEEQRTLCRAIRDRLGEANAENALGELARKGGDLKAAEARYRNAVRIATRSGLSRRWLFRLNLAHTRLACDDSAGAALMAAELLDSPLARGEPIISSSCWWIVAFDAARRADLLAFDAAADNAIRLGSVPIVEDDLVLVAQRAGDAVAPHDRVRAERAWAFARDKRRVLGKGPQPRG